MDFESLIKKMTRAAVQGNGSTVVDCFTVDGVYHDVFYGNFTGRNIARMIEYYFHPFVLHDYRVRWLFLKSNEGILVSLFGDPTPKTVDPPIKILTELYFLILSTDKIFLTFDEILKPLLHVLIHLFV